MAVPITLTYNSEIYDYSYFYTYSTSPPNSQIVNQSLAGSPFGGWALSFAYGLYTESKPLAGSNDCSIDTAVSRTSLVMPDGSRHVLHFYNAYAASFTGGSDGFYPWIYN